MGSILQSMAADYGSIGEATGSLGESTDVYGSILQSMAADYSSLWQYR